MTLFWLRIGRAGEALSQRLDGMRRDAQAHLAAVGVDEDQQSFARVLVIVALPEGDQLDEAERVVDRQGMRVRRVLLLRRPR